MNVQAHEQKAFLGWMRETGNMFTGEEYQTRFGIWMTNKRLVQEHNAANFGFQVALNRLAHLTPTEYSTLLGFRMSKSQRKAAQKINFNAPESWDWRDKGMVNPVKDQARCGSCWAFSAVQSQESIYAIKFGKLQILSEQNLVDCVTTCYGCNGGLMDLSFEYVVENQGGLWMTEADYPYTGRDGTCKFDKSKGTSKCTGYIEIIEGSESDLAEKVAAYGPACVAIDASNWSFQMYRGGIYDEPACSPYDLDHGVGCVGYGEDGKKYWIVRNSWGKSLPEQTSKMLLIHYVFVLNAMHFIARCCVATRSLISLPWPLLRYRICCSP
jgi:cathepsin L